MNRKLDGAGASSLLESFKNLVCNSISVYRISMDAS